MSSICFYDALCRKPVYLRQIASSAYDPTWERNQILSAHSLSIIHHKFNFRFARFLDLVGTSGSYYSAREVNKIPHQKDLKKSAARELVFFYVVIEQIMATPKIKPTNSVEKKYNVHIFICVRDTFSSN